MGRVSRLCCGGLPWGREGRKLASCLLHTVTTVCQFYEMFDAHKNYHYQVSTIHGDKQKIIDDLKLQRWNGFLEPPQRPYYLELGREKKSLPR